MLDPGLVCRFDFGAATFAGLRTCEAGSGFTHL